MARTALVRGGNRAIGFEACRQLARDACPGVRVDATCPGRVRTRMGSPGAGRSPEEAIDTLAWPAMLPDDGPEGGLPRCRAVPPR